jgi:hypothetical protein
MMDKYQPAEGGFNITADGKKLLYIQSCIRTMGLRKDLRLRLKAKINHNNRNNHNFLKTSFMTASRKSVNTGVDNMCLIFLPPQLIILTDRLSELKPKLESDLGIGEAGLHHYLFYHCLCHWFTGSGS